MNKYIPTIGLEIHAELKTQTKMFCNSKNDADETRPNHNICPICLAHPGTLPVINSEAVRHVLRVGKVLNGTKADYTEFDRKNYFYPDLPKGYQISQFAYPLISGGALNGVQITRIHLEEDTASSIHGSTSLTTGDGATNTTVIDYNRAGVPLMELVTEPVIRSAAQAGNFARELQLLLRSLNASEANMEKGEMRVEANISVSKDSSLGTKVEVKNLNSFRIMERAVAYEIKRQQDLLERGEKVVQETRGWDEKTGKTFPQRVKEGSADYRYFPDPDLPPLKLSLVPDFADGEIKKTMPELPDERRKRYISMGIKGEDAELYIRDMRLGEFFELVTGSYLPKSRELILASNYIANDLVNITRLRKGFGGQVRDMEERDSEHRAEIPISPANFKKIIEMISSNKISSRSAKDLLQTSIVDKRDPEVIAQEMGIFQISDSANLEAVVTDIVEKNPKVVLDYKAGKETALEYLVGQCMKSLRGAADPVVLRDLIRKRIG